MTVEIKENHEILQKYANLTKKSVFWVQCTKAVEWIGWKRRSIDSLLKKIFLLFFFKSEVLLVTKIIYLLFHLALRQSVECLSVSSGTRVTNFKKSLRLSCPPCTWRRRQTIKQSATCIVPRTAGTHTQSQYYGCSTVSVCLRLLEP